MSLDIKAAHVGVLGGGVACAVALAYAPLLANKPVSGSVSWAFERVQMVARDKIQIQYNRPLVDPYVIEFSLPPKVDQFLMNKKEVVILFANDWEAFAAKTGVLVLFGTTLLSFASHVKLPRSLSDSLIYGAVQGALVGVCSGSEHRALGALTGACLGMAGSAIGGAAGNTARHILEKLGGDMGNLPTEIILGSGFIAGSALCFLGQPSR